jgi:hypothetical protein
MRKPFKYQLGQPPRPKPIGVPEGVVVTKCPPGAAQGASVGLQRYRHSQSNPNYSGPGRLVPRKLIKVTIRCESCNTENARMVPKLNSVRAKCQQCGRDLSFRWQGVKSK